MSEQPIDTVVVHPSRKPAHLRYWALLVLSGLVWGITFSLAKIATEGGAHPLGLNLWQAGLTFVVLFGIAVARGKRVPLSVRHFRFYAVCGFFGTALPGALYFYAARHLSAGVLAITLATVPMLTLALALPLGIERLAWSRVVGLLLGIMGVALLVLPESSLPDASAVPWVLVAVGCSLCYAIENNFISLKMPDDTDPFTVLAGMMGVGTFMMLVVTWGSGSHFVPAWPPGAVEWSVAGIALATAIAYGIFIYLIASAGPVFASQMAYVVTLSGIAWGVVLFGETHSVWVWAALVVLMIGLMLVKPQDNDA